MGDAQNPFVSVIIPVFNDAERLERCLQALAVQTYSHDCYEVIVVDNGSEDAEATLHMVEKYAGAIAAVELTPGSYAARNKGIRLAKGTVIAFTDADCIPALDWIEQGVKALLSTPNCGLVAGRIEIFFRNPNQLTVVELYESILAFQQREHLEKYQYGSTANVFTFKQVLEQVGLFDATLKSNGDFEWGRRVAKAGFRQVYAENVWIAHPARYSFAQLYKRTVRLAGGIYDAQIQRCSSWIDRNKLFVRSVIEDFLAPVLHASEIFTEPKLHGAGQKLKVYALMSLVHYIRGLEKIRLKMGGVSARG